MLLLEPLGDEELIGDVGKAVLDPADFDVDVHIQVSDGDGRMTGGLKVGLIATAVLWALGAVQCVTETTLEVHRLDVRCVENAIRHFRHSGRVVSSVTSDVAVTQRKSR